MRNVFRPQAGDIIFVYGSRLRFKLARRILHMRWNHVLIYMPRLGAVELTHRGIKKTEFRVFKTKRRMIILRLIDHEKNIKKKILERIAQLENVRFDWMRYVSMWLQLPLFSSKERRMSGHYICSDYVQNIYDYLGRYEVDIDALLRHDYLSTELQQFGVKKVFDYRWGQL